MDPKYKSSKKDTMSSSSSSRVTSSPSSLTRDDKGGKWESEEHDDKASFEALFDSGYSTGALSIHSASNIHDSLKQLDSGNICTTDSGLCIDSREDIHESDDLKSQIEEKSPSPSLPPSICEEVLSKPTAYLPNEEGNTILHVAVTNKQTSSIYAIIQRVPHPDLLDVRDRLGESAMHWAVITGQHEVLRRLLVSGATIDLRNRNGDTALHIACHLADLDCVKALLKPISPSEVIEAQLHHYTPQIQGTNMIDFIHLMNYEGQTSVHLAAKTGNKKLLEYFKIMGADFGVREGKSGWSSLHWAVACGRVDLVQILISMSRVDTECYSGYTPLDLACSLARGDPNNQVFRKMIILLMEAGAKRKLFDRSDDEDSEDDIDDSDNEQT